jgi:serine protease
MLRQAFAKALAGRVEPFTAASRTQEAAGSPEVIAGEFIVRFEDKGLQAKAAMEHMRVPGYRLQHLGYASEHVHLLRFEPEDTSLRASSREEALRFAEQLRQRPGVRYVEENRRFHPAVTPNDELYPSQWHYPAMNLPAAWDVTTGSSSVVVAILDTGIKPHPDFSGRLLPGMDMISSLEISGDGNGRDTNPTDEGRDLPQNMSSWHGTHVAGTIGAATNNRVGVAGVNWNASLLPVRVLGRGGGTTFDIAAGINWAAGIAVSGVPANPTPAKVLNLSLGGPGGPSQTYQDAIDAATARGSIVVIAAGNSNSSATNFTPCNQQNVICVGALDHGGNRASYSNFGAPVDVMAPGGDFADGPREGVLSTFYDSTGTQPTYAQNNGTSMAAPHVAGLVSLMAAVNPNLTLQQAETILKATASADFRCSEGCGAGLVDAHAAVLSARNGGGTPGDPGSAPKLGVATTQLSFTGSGTQNLQVRNQGGGTLQVIASISGANASMLSLPGGNTLSIPALSSKPLPVAVNTTGFPNGNYSAQLALTGANGAGTVQLLVKIQVGRPPDKDVLLSFIYEDPTTGEFKLDEEGVQVVTAANEYRYSLKLTPRAYLAAATIDDDGDQVFFEETDRVGFWRNLNSLESIDLKAGQTVSGIDFDVLLLAPVDDTPTLDIGAACTSPTDCPGGICGTNYPGGYCTLECSTAACPAGSKCYLFENGTAAYCLASCGVQSDCRTGYACYDDRAGGGICQPG